MDKKDKDEEKIKKIRREGASRRKQEASYNCLESLTSIWIRTRRIRIKKKLKKIMDKEGKGKETETGGSLEILTSLFPKCKFYLF